MRTMATLLVLVQALAACGRDGLKPSGGKDEEEPARTADGKPVEVIGKTASLSMTAEYLPEKIDILIIRESSGPFSEGFFADRLAQAVPTLAARLQFSGLDYRVGFLNAGVPRPPDPNMVPPPAPEFGGDLLETAGEPFLGLGHDILDKKMMVGFIAAREDRPQMPLTALKLATERSTTAGSTTNGFFRDDAMLAVVFLQSSDERDEQMLPTDIVELLDGFKGRGRYMISAIAPDTDGCDITDDWRTNDEEYVRRNLVVRLQAATGGLFTSLCDTTYAYFFDQLLLQGTPVMHFPVTLAEPAMWSSIEVLSGPPEAQVSIKGWKYKPGELTIQLPRLIPAGTDVVLNYEVDEGLRPNESLTPLEELAVLTERTLSPEELEFNAEVNPVLARSCNGGGCHGAGTSRNRYVDRFKTVITNKMMILDYIQRPASDPMYMPRGGTMSSEDFDVLYNWLSAQ